MATLVVSYTYDVVLYVRPTSVNSTTDIGLKAVAATWFPTLRTKAVFTRKQGIPARDDPFQCIDWYVVSNFL